MAKYVIVGKKPNSQVQKISAIVFPNKKSADNALKAVRQIHGGRYEGIEVITLKQFKDGEDKKN